MDQPPPADENQAGQPQPPAPPPVHQPASPPVQPPQQPPFQQPPTPPQAYPHYPAAPPTPPIPHGLVRYGGAAYVPAGFWYRLGAFLIDMVILVLAHQLLVLIADVPQPDIEQMFGILERLLDDLARGGMPGQGTEAAMLELMAPVRFAGWLNVAMCAAYFIVFHGTVGATLGKLCLGLRVMRRDGTPLSYGWAFVRYIGYFLTARLAYTAWIMPFDAERRTLYDIVLGTNTFRHLPRQ